LSKSRSFFEKLRDKFFSALNVFLYKSAANKWFLIAVALFNSIIIYFLAMHLPFPISAILSAIVVFGSLVLVFFLGTLKRMGIIPVSDDLIYILVHMRCMVTGNPALTTVFSKVGETHFYKKKYRNLFRKLSGLIKNWGYSTPEALRLVSREVGSKVDKMFLQRLAAIVVTGGDVKEYLRIEYNTLFAEYVSGFNRMIDVLRVVLGVYTTLLGALTFMMANLMLLGMIFGGMMSLIATGVTSIGFALFSMSILLYVFTRRPFFESKPRKKTRILLIISLTGLMGFVFFTILLAYLLVSGNIYSMEYVGLSLTIAGLIFLPSGIMVRIYEGRINEYDMFFPAFIRSYGEQMATLPNMVESLKPLLMAELGKLKKLLNNVYARLLNRVDPRIAWSLFADESGSEMVTRGTHIFVDTVELGGDLATTGAILSDHTNELFRLRVAYTQVFRTFETTLYLMHLTALILLVFIGSFINVFSGIVTSFAQSIPSEYAKILGFLIVSPIDVSLVTSVTSVVMVAANTIALYAVAPGSRYGIFYYISIILIVTGMAVYVSSHILTGLIGSLLQPIVYPISSPP